MYPLDAHGVFAPVQNCRHIRVSGECPTCVRHGLASLRRVPLLLTLVVVNSSSSISGLMQGIFLLTHVVVNSSFSIC